MAIPLTNFLDPQGSYEGFDIVPLGIHWCRDNITQCYPNFQFRLLDVRNSSYNPPRPRAGPRGHLPLPGREL